MRKGLSLDMSTWNGTFLWSRRTVSPSLVRDVWSSFPLTWRGGWGVGGNMCT
ncbi:hypothetical protein EYF80_025899 [Liparis tanakae]|uniref:Uncharacterized protein n=1 Tax=Liparis tanakae TaxID=230148 RepID=A0A4Z2HE62_9TELE|nr:hypothetical protein EYF80_025899 [Liparis tanakae]